MALIPPLYHGNPIKASPGIALGWFSSAGGVLTHLTDKKMIVRLSY